MGFGQDEGKSETVTAAHMSNLRLSLEQGVNVQRRIIYLWDEVSEALADTVVKGIDELEAIDGSTEITLRVATFGGCIYSMFKIYDRMRSSTCPIKTISEGMVMSAGLLIAMGGDKGLRYANEECQFMYHKGSFELEGEAHNAFGTAEHYKVLQKRVLSLTASRSKKPVSYWRKVESEKIDKFYTAKQAKTLGIVDHIIKNKKS